MKYIILGLISLKSMSGYEIAKFIENNLALICSSSAGSIQTALKKLLKLDFIEYEEIVEKGKNKKIFSITEKGRDEFNEWLQNPMQLEKVKNMELSKLFFLGFAEKQDRIDMVKNYIEQLNGVKNMLFVIEKEMENAKKIAIKEMKHDNTADILTYQLYTLKYGIDSAEFEMNWYRKLLTEMEA